MATNFVTELGNLFTLPPNNRNEFYTKLKMTVVDLKICGTLNKLLTHGGGMCVSEQGLILTSYRLIQTSQINNIQARFFGQIDYYPAVCLCHDKGSDLAIIKQDSKYAKEEPRVYVEFCADNIGVGSEALYIHHSQNLLYTLTIGQVAYPPSTESPVKPIDSKVIIPPRTIDSLDLRAENLHEWESCSKELQLLQVNNIHGGPGVSASGSPIFGSNGRVIGMRVFSCSGFDFAIPADTLQKFVSDQVPKLSKPTETPQQKQKKVDARGKSTQMPQLKQNKGNASGKPSQRPHQKQKKEDASGKLTQTSQHKQKKRDARGNCFTVFEPVEKASGKTSMGADSISVQLGFPITSRTMNVKNMKPYSNTATDFLQKLSVKAAGNMATTSVIKTPNTIMQKEASTSQAIKKKALQESKSHTGKSLVSGWPPNKFWQVSPTVSVYKNKAHKNGIGNVKQGDTVIEKLHRSKTSNDVTESCYEKIDELAHMWMERGLEAKELCAVSAVNLSFFRSFRLRMHDVQSQISILQEKVGNLNSRKQEWDSEIMVREPEAIM